MNLLNIEAAPTNLPINVNLPRIKEVSSPIGQIKSGKPEVGSNSIAAESLKSSN